MLLDFKAGVWEMKSKKIERKSSIAERKSVTKTNKGNGHYNDDKSELKISWWCMQQPDELRYHTK